jgi:Peptidase A4 family
MKEISHSGASGFAGRALFAALTEPRRSHKRGMPGLGRSVTILRARRFGAPRRGHSVPLFAEDGALCCRSCGCPYDANGGSHGAEPFIVSPGDIIEASASYVGGSYLLQLKDLTNGGNFFTTQTCNPNVVCKRGTAEWIVERPGGGAYPLADYSTVEFANVEELHSAAQMIVDELRRRSPATSDASTSPTRKRASVHSLKSPSPTS